jgi:hypothetical protein
MIKPSPWFFTLGAVGVSAAALAFVACSSSSGGGSPDASEDTTAADSSATDATGSDVAAMDSSTVDVGTDHAISDGGPPDAADAADATEAGATCTVFDASGLDEASVAAGFQEVWSVYRCWGCHQKSSQTVDDAGNGIVLSGNNDGLGDSGRFPPNLTNDPTTGLGCWANQQIQDAILNGVDPEGGALCPPMPKWGSSLGRPGTPMDAGTAQEIISFLRSLTPVMNLVPDTTCPTADGGSDAGVGDATGQ